MKQDFIKKLRDRESQGNLRRLTTPTKSLVDFVSNDYLGLSRSRTLFDKINNYSYEGITHLNGSAGSRLLAGNTSHAETLERKLAKIFRAEACLLFNSGYVANLALISSLPQRQDTIIYDSLAHVCIKEGAKLSSAKSYSFRHNDPEDLEKKIKNSQGQVYIVIESVYSMDGDMACFDELLAVAKKHDAQLLVDEAHGTGLYGEQGNGLVCHLGIEDQFIGRVYTFGKAMGVHGACIAGSQELIDYLTNFARSFIYTTALPIHSIFAIDAAFDYLGEHIHLQQEIQDKISFFNQYYQETIGNKDRCYKPESLTPIQPLIVPGNQTVKQLSDTLLQEGFDVRAILSPTVPVGSERLRICLHQHNTTTEIRAMVDLLSSHL
ncbi:8-amino-7-oxononanoate synthase [Reichenbachiella agariperforans]|uniref:8-amino-7-oxononanoate synthase n=1 Tax=Reichenbachiella agariperforans TaxID=156994 RepID=A0A1M6T457_REIAG|nr:8-amino-7-oxononanoate synthase [Reichenbachiella agariperforans]SHK51793.1 8-amino-7-oxononanoate synthase [Reichenbachiella agariperforans]